MELIERMYPELPKIELFARAAREGWTAWGNQSQPAGAATDPFEIPPMLDRCEVG
jgi:N6-adenosine-specific RNA methylase IME4